MSEQEKIIKQNEEYQFESQMYVLHEMRDELEKAISNLNTVMSQEEELLDILNKDEKNNNKRKHDWSKFKDGLGDSRKNYTTQLERMTNKLTHVDALIKIHENTGTEQEKLMSETVDMIVSYILIALS